MITTTDVANIIYKDCCSALSIPVYQKGNIPVGEIDSERVIIHSKQQNSETTWLKNYIEVNIYTPNDENNKCNLIRLNELERTAKKALNKTGRFDDTPYTYKVDSTELMEDLDFKAGFVNVRILFCVLNTIE